MLSSINVGVPVSNHTFPSALLRTICLAVLVVLGMSVSVVAQPTVSVRGNVGASFFQSPDVLSETLHSGVDLGLGAGVRVWRGLSLTVRGGYDQFTLNEENLRTLSQGSPSGLIQGDVSFYNGSLGLRYTYQNQTDAHPYLATGLGFYQRTISNLKAFREGQVETRDGNRTDTALSAHLALGSLVRLNDTYALFFEPRYVFYDVSERVSGAQRYFTLRVGMDVQFGEGGLF